MIGLKVCLILDWLFGATEKEGIKTASDICWIGEDLTLVFKSCF